MVSVADPAQTNPAFTRLSSPLGNSPFDKALCARDAAVFSANAKTTKGSKTDSERFRDTVVADCREVFPGLGDFGPGGGILR